MVLAIRLNVLTGVVFVEDVGKGHVEEEPFIPANGVIQYRVHPLLLVDMLKGDEAAYRHHGVALRIF